MNFIKFTIFHTAKLQIQRLYVLHEYILETLGRENDEETLCGHVLYREDCTLKYDFRGKPYHHKDLSKFGCDLSRVILLDNSPVVSVGEQPNTILIKDYFGRDEEDDELMEVYQLLDAVSTIPGDIRYFLCGLDQDPDTEHNEIDFEAEESCWNATESLIAAMKAYYEDHLSSGDDVEEEEDLGYLADGMMDDMDDSDVENDSIFHRVHSTRILDELEIDITDSLNPATPSKMEREEIPTLNTSNSSNRTTQSKRRGSDSKAYIPPKRTKQESVTELRDLNVILKQKRAQTARKRTRFFDNDDAETLNSTRSQPIRSRKRSAVRTNTMAPKPDSRTLLHNSQHEDFFMLLLQQLDSKTMQEVQQLENQKIMERQNREIDTLQDMVYELQIKSSTKTDTLEEYRQREEEYKQEMESFNRIETMKKDNHRIQMELEVINDRIRALDRHKKTLQKEINEVVASKIRLIQTASEELDRYKKMIAQIAKRKVTVTV